MSPFMAPMQTHRCCRWKCKSQVPSAGVRTSWYENEGAQECGNHGEGCGLRAGWFQQPLRSSVSPSAVYHQALDTQLGGKLPGYIHSVRSCWISWAESAVSFQTTPDKRGIRKFGPFLIICGRGTQQSGYICRALLMCKVIKVVAIRVHGLVGRPGLYAHSHPHK